MNERRTSLQNRKLWAMLSDIARQVLWPVWNPERGEYQEEWLDETDWKHILSADLRRQERKAAGISGGFVILGQRTSEFSRSEFADLLTIVQKFGDEKRVRWTDPNLISLMESA